MVFYESPRRLISFLKEIKKTLGDREAVLCREMTKPHEEFLRGPVSVILRTVQNRPAVKGECTLLIGNVGATKDSPFLTDTVKNEIKARLQEKKDKIGAIAKALAVKHGVSKKLVYDEALKIKGDDHDG